MARVVADDVISALSDYNETVSLTAPIQAATLLVDQVAAKDSTVSDDLLFEIERWLAAHFYSVIEMQVISERAAEVGETKANYVSYGFQTTMYGSQAMMLDPTGHLAELSSKAKANLSDLKKSVTRVGVSYIGRKSCDD